MILFRSSVLLFAMLNLTKRRCSAQQQQDPLTMNGGSLLAMAGKECVALAVDKRFGSGPQLINVAPRHIFSPHSSLVLGFSGLEGDVQSLSENIRAEIEYGRNRELGFNISPSTDSDNCNNLTKKRRISPPALACRTSHILYERGYYVEPIVVGLMDITRKPFLCAMDMIGAKSFSKSFICSGAASTSLYGTAEALWRPNMEPKELLECCGTVFQSSLERDCLSGYGILVYLITNDGVTCYSLASRND